MRIVMLAQFYPPSLGGEEQHVRNLASGLASRGHSVAVATLSQEKIGRKPVMEMDGAVRVYRLPGTAQRFEGLFSDASHRFAPPLPDPETALALRDVMHNEQPEVVHAHNWLLHSFLPLKPWIGAKLVVTLHDYSLVCSQKRLMRKGEVCCGPALGKCQSCAMQHYGGFKGLVTSTAVQLLKPVEVRTVDFFISVSSAVAEGNSLDSHDVEHAVIPNFVPDDVADRCDPEDPALASLPPEPFFLFAGDLSRDKGIFVLLEAYRALPQPKMPLVLIGKRRPETPAALPDGAVLLPSMPHAAVMAAWGRSAVAIVPSIWPDPCPTVAMEALSAGVPVIAARSGGLIDIVEDQENGLIVEPGDVDGLAEAMQRMVDDQVLRQRLRHGAARRIIHFQAGSVIPRIESLYERLLAR